MVVIWVYGCWFGCCLVVVWFLVGCMGSVSQGLWLYGLFLRGFVLTNHKTNWYVSSLFYQGFMWLCGWSNFPKSMRLVGFRKFTFWVGYKTRPIWFYLGFGLVGSKFSYNFYNKELTYRYFFFGGGGGGVIFFFRTRFEFQWSIYICIEI